MNTKKVVWGLADSLAMSGASGTVTMAEPGAYHCCQPLQKAGETPN